MRPDLRAEGLSAVSLGRYLQPEPLLQSPAYAVAMAGEGMSTPSYAYAANNPVGYIDTNGLYFSSHSAQAWASLSRLAQNPVIGRQIEMMQADKTRRFTITDTTRFSHSGGGLTKFHETGSADINLDMEYGTRPANRVFSIA